MVAIKFWETICPLHQFFTEFPYFCSICNSLQDDSRHLHCVHDHDFQPSERLGRGQLLIAISKTSIKLWQVSQAPIAQC